MSRYRAVFQETCTYVVEFESDAAFDTDDDSWFDALDAAQPNWLTDPKTQVSVDDRELHELTTLEAATQKETPA